MSMILFASTTAASLIVGIVSNLGKPMVHAKPNLLRLHESSDMMF